jgi:TRAP-type transport system periplasmic protein
MEGEKGTGGRSFANKQCTKEDFFMKKTYRILFITALILSFFTVPFMVPAPSAKTITLKFGTWQAGGQKNPLTVGQYTYLDELEKRTNGAVKFERYDAGSLAPGPALLEALQAGMADTAGICPPYYRKELPLHQLTVLPGFSEYPYPKSMAFYRLYDRIPELKAELTKHNIKLLSIQALKSSGVFSKKPVRAIPDFKGMKLRVLGYQAELLAALGGVPVSMATSEIYEGLSKGTIDGHIHNSPAIIAFGTFQLAKYYTEFNFGDPVFLIGMNQNTYNRLPDSVKKVIEEMMVEGIEKSNEACARGNKALDGKMKEVGIEFIKPPAADEAKVAEETDKILDKWIKELEAKGLPAGKVASEYKKLITEFKPLPIWSK